MKGLYELVGCTAVLASVALAVPAHAVPVIFSGSGAGATTAFTNFQTAIGGGVRIGWDGVRVDGTDANPATRILAENTVEIPVDRFAGVGAIFADPYAVSGDEFANANPDAAGEFAAFSPENTFVMFDTDPTDGEFNDQFIEQTFVFPGTTTPAGTRGFGAIFVDVEQAGSSSIEYRGQDRNGNPVSLGTFPVPTGTSGQPQFLGVLFDNPVVTEVVLTVGTNALFSLNGSTVNSFGPENLTDGTDLVITDDFLFATPETSQAVPEPSALFLSVAALMAFLFLRRRTAFTP